MDVPIVSSSAKLSLWAFFTAQPLESISDEFFGVELMGKEALGVCKWTIRKGGFYISLGVPEDSSSPAVHRHLLVVPASGPICNFS